MRVEHQRVRSAVALFDVARAWMASIRKSTRNGKKFYEQSVDGLLATTDVTLFSNYYTSPRSSRIPVPFAKLRQVSGSFEREGADGTQSTFDNTAAFVTARIFVDLSLRLRLLTASSACPADMGGIG